MNARLIISKETKDKMKKKISEREKGKVLFARLQELEADGTLSKAQTRADAARLVGYPEERANAGYAWVSTLIRRGNLNETIREWTPDGERISEYHTTGKMLDYNCEAQHKRKGEQEWRRRWQDKVEAGYTPQAPEPQVYNEEQVASDTKIMAPIKIEITRGDMTIKVEMDSYERASKIISDILKGE